jgi:hypothetical protein
MEVLHAADSQRSVQSSHESEFFRWAPEILEYNFQARARLQSPSDVTVHHNWSTLSLRLQPSSEDSRDYFYIIIASASVALDRGVGENAIFDAS